MSSSLVLDSTTTLGPIRDMHAVNNGPTKPRANQSRSNFETFKTLQIPYARIHDANWCPGYGAPHVVDITAIFPDFDADVNDPASYDFKLTDIYLQTIVDAGAKVFYRLGQSIEHQPKKYGVHLPKDLQKWAEICEHIVRHYTEGWADGLKLDIAYWEIWNEPDLSKDFENGDPTCSTWTGSLMDFCNLYEVAAKHLKKCFPQLKVGGPAVAYNVQWAERFLTEMKKREVPMDFFSWHCYSTKSKWTLDKARQIHEVMERTGYADAESILNEWNYVRNFGHEGFIYSLEVESGKFNLKGGAYIADHFIQFQNTTRVDMMMYYDARVGCLMNGLFDRVSNEPTKTYYAFYAWSKLKALGTQTVAEVNWEQPTNNPAALCDLAATAARSADGTKNAVLLVRFNDDNNVVATTEVTIQLKDGTPLKDVRCHLTDDYHTYTEVPLVVGEDGVPKLKLYPNAFALIEWTQA